MAAPQEVNGDLGLDGLNLYCLIRTGPPLAQAICPTWVLPVHPGLFRANQVDLPSTDCICLFAMLYLQHDIAQQLALQLPCLN